MYPIHHTGEVEHAFCWLLHPSGHDFFIWQVGPWRPECIPSLPPTNQRYSTLYWNVFSCGEKHPLIRSFSLYTRYVCVRYVSVITLCVLNYIYTTVHVHVCLYSSRGTTTMRFSVACARLVSTTFCRSTNLSVDLVVSLLKILLIVFAMAHCQIKPRLAR